MWLNNRTEFTFGAVYGHIDDVAKKGAEIARANDCNWAGITDIGNTFGFVRWQKACKKNDVQPIFGVTIAVVPELGLKVQRYDYNMMTFIAKTEGAITELYALVTKSYVQFYYRPLISYRQINQLSKDVVIMSGNGPKLNLINREFFLQLSPDLPLAMRNIKGIPGIAAIDNWYVDIGDKEVYEPFADDRKLERKSTIQHIPTIKEWLQLYPGKESAIENLIKIGKSINYELPKAPIIKWIGDDDILKMCKEGAKIRKIDIKKGVYLDRLKRELDLIHQKKFVDYFLVVADVVAYAKKHMVVGPARGSSAGSLVCYLLGITEIDPIPYGLIFERFIDINRLDLPDIDIDFQDNKRHLIFSYLEKKYGSENIAQIGNISRLKPKSAISRFAKSLGIPISDVEELKDGIIERSSGDARSTFCIQDAMESTDVGKAFIERYPQMSVVSRIEAHASHSGIHAAGILLSNKPITNYCAMNARDNNIAMIDKKDAESLNLLKIDALGLRTLTILAEICDMLGKPYDWIYKIPLDDKKAYKLFRKKRLHGIFQFEGEAIKVLNNQMRISILDDLSAMGALCRPGPLHCGGAVEFIQRRIGNQKVEYLDDHPAIINNTKDTFGVIIYQEQVMTIGRDYGDLSWEDVSELRKAMSKSLGDEFFDQYKKKFVAGAIKKGADEMVATAVWDKMCTFGSWSFNKSHAVSYGIITYLTAYMKVNYPKEFTVASLNNTRSDEGGIKILRDMVESEGIKYVPFDKDISTDRWHIKNNILYGSLVNLAGIAESKAATIIKSRATGKALTPSLQRAIDEGDTPYKYLYPARDLYGKHYSNPPFKCPHVSTIINIQTKNPGMYAFLGRMIIKNLRDVNEVGTVAKRGRYMDPPTSYLHLILEDDTDSIFATIGRFHYEELGKEIAESGKEGKDWYFVIGDLNVQYRKIIIQKIKRITI